VQVQNWMSPDVMTVERDSPIIQVIRILEENDIRHLPVMDRGKVIGMITDQQVREAYPARTTPISAQELHYLLSDMKAEDVMRPNPVTVTPDQTMEVAAVMMLEYKLSAIPVATEAGTLVGIISQGDVFRVLISITGIYQGGVQLAFNLEDRPGSIKDVAQVIRQEEGQIVSILSTRDTADEGFRNVFIRIVKIPEERLQRMIERLEKDYMLLYVVKDPLKYI